ncbi:hypothetical protein GCM10011506_32860 [Marivirga lumbricoides]|uniref:Lipoprotein n=1 Tax=Marivirga lumbricoides TaxID=1046115 RepID=A0ABQ1MQC5_9BACT|nr:hypothetical protein GCM10011506_32860 [Marivirga lumbricoides]
MRINIFPLAVVFLTLVLSCQKKYEDQGTNSIKALYGNLTEQKKYYYEVEYTEGLAHQEPVFLLYGTGKLTRSSYGSLSGFYFGLTKSVKENYLQIIRNDDQTIENLISTDFDDAAIDVLADSLHSAILLNPEWLLTLINEAEKMSVKNADEGSLITLTFPNRKRTIEIISSEDNKELLQLSIHRSLPDNSTYSRKWYFKYLQNDVYDEQVAIFSKQSGAASKNFL